MCCPKLQLFCQCTIVLGNVVSLSMYRGCKLSQWTHLYVVLDLFNISSRWTAGFPGQESPMSSTWTSVSPNSAAIISTVSRLRQWTSFPRWDSVIGPSRRWLGNLDSWACSWLPAAMTGEPTPSAIQTTRASDEREKWKVVQESEWWARIVEDTPTKLHTYFADSAIT